MLIAWVAHPEAKWRVTGQGKVKMAAGKSFSAFMAGIRDLHSILYVTQNFGGIDQSKFFFKDRSDCYVRNSKLNKNTGEGTNPTIQGR